MAAQFNKADVDYLVNDKKFVSALPSIVESQSEFVMQAHIKEVRDILNKKRLVYKEREKVAGHLETHSVNFLVPANRRAGLAIAVLPGHNSHLIAEAWGFKCDDIRGVNSNLKIGLVYDVSGETWGVESRHILEKKADLAVASDSLPTFEERLPS